MKEETIIELRRTKWMLIKPAAILAGGFLVVVLVFFSAGASWVFSLFFFLWLLAFVPYSLFSYFLWKKDLYVITTERVKIKEQIKLFKKNVQEVLIRDIVDASWSVSGILPTIFNFGTVSIQTASSDPVLMANIENPSVLQELILKLKQEKSKDGGNDVTLSNLLKILDEEKLRYLDQQNKKRFKHKKIDSVRKR